MQSWSNRTGDTLLHIIVQGFSMALAGNTLLLTYFIGKRESSAALIQALGVGSNFILLAQVRPQHIAYRSWPLPSTQRCLRGMLCMSAIAHPAAAWLRQRLYRVICTNEIQLQRPACLRSLHPCLRLSLLQISIAGFMPRAAFGAAAVAVAAAVVMNGAKLSGVLDRLPAGGDIWALWSEVLGLLGLVILPQVRSLAP